MTCIKEYFSTTLIKKAKFVLICLFSVHSQRFRTTTSRSLLIIYYGYPTDCFFTISSAINVLYFTQYDTLLLIGSIFYFLMFRYNKRYLLLN